MKVRKSIKKPRFIISYLGSFVIVAIILSCMGLIAFYGASNPYFWSIFHKQVKDSKYILTTKK